MFEQEKNTVQAENAVAEKKPVEQSQATEQGSLPEIKPVEMPGIGSFGALVLLATVIAVAGVGILYWMSISKTGEVSTKQAEFDSVNQQLISGDMAKVSQDLLEISEGKSALSQALSNRVPWSKFWQKLGSNTPKTVYYNTMTIDKEGVISVGGIADNFGSVAKLMVSLQNVKSFGDVQLGSTSLKDVDGKKRTVFTIKLRVDSNLLGQET